MRYFPMPGDQLERVGTGEFGLHVIASDHYTDDIAVVLVTYPSVPHFRVFNIDLTDPLHRATPVCPRVHNIGTAVREYYHAGGTVNDIDAHGFAPRATRGTITS